MTTGEPQGLFEPSVQDHAPRVPDAERDRPWRISSQGYVAFFGGPLAITAIAAINTSKLRLPQSVRVKILVAGVVAFAAELLLTALVVGDNSSLWRLAAILLGLAVFAVAALLQRPADRGYSFRHGDEGYAALLGPGLAAVVIARIVEIMFVLPMAGV